MRSGEAPNEGGSAFGDGVEQLRQAVAAKKCWPCGCLHGGLTAIERARRAIGHMVKIEVEVETLEQLAEALAAGVDAVLLDNMALPMLAEAVARIGGQAISEACGRITRATVAATGVDVISVGWITHSAPALDLGLDLDAAAA